MERNQMNPFYVVTNAVKQNLLLFLKEKAKKTEIINPGVMIIHRMKKVLTKMVIRRTMVGRSPDLKIEEELAKMRSVVCSYIRN